MRDGKVAVVNTEAERKQRAAAQNQPDFVAVPEGADRIHQHAPFAVIASGQVQDADAEVEPVEQHVHEDGEPEDAGPDGNEVDGHGAVPV